jgi:5,5'-dehydrodivanillate O-demethylase
VVRWVRICNYFNNIDNSLDNAHVRFVHRRHRDNVSDKAAVGDPKISVEESDWGVQRYVQFPNGAEMVAHFGMPNINYINGQVVDFDIKRADSLIYKVPVNDNEHYQFEVRIIPLKGEAAERWLERRRAARAEEAKTRPDLIRAVIEGRLRLKDIDPNRTDYVVLEDELATVGQGTRADRTQEHLGGSDRGVFLLRKIWERELRALADGRPLKQWVYQPDMLPAYPAS